MKLKPASQTVLILLLGIAGFELAISSRFGKLWNLAFQPVKPAASTSSAPTPHLPTFGPTQPGTPSSGDPLTGTSSNFD